MANIPFGMRSSAGSGGRRRGGFRWWVILLFAGYALWYWFGHREDAAFTGRQQLIDSSLEQEAELGLQAYRQILGEARSQGALVDPSHPTAQQIQSIARRMVDRADEVEVDLARARGVQPSTQWSAFAWEVNLIQSEQANAFCLPGGKMAVYTGLLPVAQNEDALAIVMGHEIAHALLRHGAERMAQQKLVQMGQMAAGVAVGEMDPQQQQMVLAALGAGTQYGVMLPFSREHETEADRIGLYLAAAACFDPAEAPRLWERMASGSGGGPPEFMSTHPNPATRIETLRSLVPEAERIRARYCGG
jgi:predicted Zn-dependent protease